MLDRLVARFTELDYELCVVDQTVGPVADCGLCAVRVVAPELLPLNVNYNIKFGATPRLYEAPKRMAHPARDYAGFNRWPQPFA
jgi:ribosomal protein S12 methylthiotransferase accessory factor